MTPPRFTSPFESLRSKLQSRPALNKQRKAILAVLAVALFGTLLQLFSMGSMRVATIGFVLELLGLIPLGTYAIVLIPRATMQMFLVKWTPRLRTATTTPPVVPTLQATEIPAATDESTAMSADISTPNQAE